MLFWFWCLPTAFFLIHAFGATSTAKDANAQPLSGIGQAISFDAKCIQPFEFSYLILRVCFFSLRNSLPVKVSQSMCDMVEATKPKY